MARKTKLSDLLRWMKQQTREQEWEQRTGQNDVPTLKQWLDENVPLPDEKPKSK